MSDNDDNINTIKAYAELVGVRIAFYGPKVNCTYGYQLWVSGTRSGSARTKAKQPLLSPVRGDWVDKEFVKKAMEAIQVSAERRIAGDYKPYLPSDILRKS